MQFLKYYQGIPLDLSDVSKLFKMIGNGITDKKKHLSETGYGDNKVRAIKEYLKDFDLLAEKGALTPLGSIVFKNDPRFLEPFTRWILLYHWSLKKNNPYLNFLVNETYGITEKDKLEERFRMWASKNQIKTEYDKNKMVDGLMNLTKNALIDINAFHYLNFFNKSGDMVSRGEPYHVETLLIAYIFYYNRKKRTSVGFSELTQERDNVALFFDFNHKVLEERVIDLNNIGLTRLIQFADLHYVEYCYDGEALELINKYYDEN